MNNTHQYIDMSTKRVGTLQVIEYAFTKGKKAYFKCICDCSKIKFFWGPSLRNGTVSSCGSCSKYRHGFLLLDSENYKINKKFYIAWQAMIQRCTNPNNPQYGEYGDRDIIICDRWLGKDGFINFRDDMYEPYLKHIKLNGGRDTSLDRIDVNGNYEPSNCRWATQKIQNGNMQRSPKTENHDEHLRQGSILRSMVSHSFSKEPGKRATINFTAKIGLSPIEFKNYIEAKFLPGMTWDNYGNGKYKWNIDHIKPTNRFDLSKEIDRLTCWNYTNLQPMWYNDNLKKGTIWSE